MRRRFSSFYKKAMFALVALLFAALVVAVGRPLLHIALVWWNDPAAPLEFAGAGKNDVSGLSPNQPAEVIPIAAEPAAAEQQLLALVRRAASEKKAISISGARHSMGGHTLVENGLVLDMLPFDRMSLDEEPRLLTVGAGARWSQVIPFLDKKGLAVAVMQSNNDFTVGGSISVNCHGWQNDSPPIASTVESFRIVTADGKVRQCSRKENSELFSLALGGYGLFGIILDVKLRVVPNEYYRAEAFPVKAADYARHYEALTERRKDVGMAYGRICVAPQAFLEEGIITLLKREKTDKPLSNTISDTPPTLIKRLVFRGGVGSDYGKNLRWQMETLFGETAGMLLSRNQIMNEPSSWFANRDAGSAEILHEYFLPVSALEEFFKKAKPVFAQHRPDLLNITVRNVDADHDSFLRYARKDVFGVVMLFHQGRDDASEKSMRAFAQDLLAVVLACQGTYYLPYRPHATREQFQAAYPQAREFFTLKKRYDPGEIFQNQFYQKYGRPLVNQP